ncbi:hypothetical protein PGTUg99_026276 [Puccinia graminis f. sp. tritici]|uniref:Uncharacterized protein n=1 Tax=Puccinia graminis f. sp. tritici TaxID=56615 RepID=A0A5B0Q1J9_PUCGR|nr:hypothetical protein PGTUg99_026276 [Puccinia graminis f. sp. tritici]
MSPNICGGQAERKNIWVAAGDGDLERVKELIQAGLSPTVADENSYTPLHAAASWGRLEVLKYLHSQGGDMNTTDDEGDTPLFSVEDLETAKLVIALGGDPRHKNAEGKTAAENLFEDYPEVSNYLRSVNGESPLEDRESNDPEDRLQGEETSQEDPTSSMTQTLIEKVREMMTEAESNGIDSESPELDLRLRELVTKTVDQSVGLGKQLAAGARDLSQSSPTIVSHDLATVAEGDEPPEESSQVVDQAEANKRQKT